MRRHLPFRLKLWSRWGAAASAPLVAVLLLALAVNALAGDILRGGVRSNPAAQRAAAESRSRAADAAAAAARQRVNDRLSATTRAISAMQGAQAAARAAAAAQSLVPDGLAEGGLKVLTGPQARWLGANAPVQSALAGKVHVDIKQTAQQAILHWETFNVGRNTRLNFDQSAGGADAGKWTVLNKIFDPKGRMTEIYGRVQGQGQIHLINRSGFVVRAGGSVDARSIVVSSLPINDRLVERGLINQDPKSVQFLFSGLARDAFDRDLDLDGNGMMEAGKDYFASRPSGDVTIEEGARLAARTSAERVGGRITLVGANVSNRGTLSSPDGQTILAAGRQVGFDAHPTADPTLRGLDVYVGEVDQTSGEAVNAGLIEVPRANVTIAGRTVRQLGVIQSATSATLNGRVDLLANFNSKTYTEVTGGDYPSSQATTTPLFYHGESGLVELGPGSVTSILPDLSGIDRAVGTKLALGSLVNIQGRAIRMASGSVIHAPSASLPSGKTVAVDGSRDIGSGSLLAGVTMRAGNWVRAQGAVTRWANSDRLLDAAGQPYVGGQIYFEPGSVVDVSGLAGVAVPLSHYLLTVQLRGAELANSVLQRNGPVRGTSLTVDLRRTGSFNGQYWQGTPLGDVSGYAGIIERGVGELSVNGGTVSLAAGEAVIMQKGSLIDVSGGTRQVSGGRVATTRLLSGGQIIDIAEATPDRVYDGIYTGRTTSTSAKWGVSRTYLNPLAPIGEYYQRPYAEGADAGRVQISAASVALDGSLTGQVTQGLRQLNPSERDFNALPTLARGGTLQLSFRNQGLFNNAFVTQSPTPPDIVFGLAGLLPAAEPFSITTDGVVTALRDERKEKVWLSPKLLGDAGFGTLSVDNSDGNITVPAGTPLNAPLLGSISLSGANISIGSSVTAPGGSLSFTAYNYSPHEFNKFNGTVFEPPSPDPAPDRGVFTLASGARLSTAGLLTDRRPGFGEPSALGTPLVNGGSISINSYTARLNAGSLIDASGGLAVSSVGRRNFGSGGSISIAAGRDPSMTWLLGGRLTLDSVLQSYSGGRLAGLGASGNAVFAGDSRFRGYMGGAMWEAKGGSLAIQAPLIRIGGSAPSGVAADEMLLLSPGFFTRGGFTSYTLTGLGRPIDAGLNQFEPGVVIAPGTVIRPVADNWHASLVGGRLQLQPFTRPASLSPAVSIAFNSPVLRDGWDPVDPLVARGDILMGEGARIETKPAASVAFSGGTVAILGSIIAPAGNISVRGADSFPLFRESDLTAALPTVHLGPRSLLSAAGTTALVPDLFGRRTGFVLAGGSIAASGNIVAEAGSVLDVSGASDVLDVHPWLLARNILALGGVSPRVPSTSGLTTAPFFTTAESVRVDSDAGSISLLGSQQLLVDATLRGFAGGPSARGGILSVSSGRFIDKNAGVGASPLDLNLLVTQSGSFLPVGFYPEGETAIGRLVPVADGTSSLGRGRFAVDSFVAGGFDSLKLSGGAQGAVGFFGPVSIQARGLLDIADGGVISADSLVHLSAPYISLGGDFQTPAQLGTSQADSLSLPGRNYVVPTSGSGRLIVAGSLIDVGNLSLQGISTASLLAYGGDIRGNGALNIAGTLDLAAGQVFPTTAGLFNIVAYDPNIRVAASSTSSRIVRLASAQLPSGFGVGSSLLGSTVESVTGDTVTLASNANADISAPTPLVFAPGQGTVNITSSGRRPPPLSAGGTLGIYAANILQGGTLRAPFGTINLGWDGRGTPPKDYLSGAGIVAGRSVPVTQSLTLAPGSLTSVSGAGLVVPYGYSTDGTSWIDPTGVDISGSGPPVKAVNLAALDLSSLEGSRVDVSGGGDLYAYRWVQGNGGAHDLLGTPSADWSASTSYESGQLVWHDGAIWSARRSNQGVAPSVGADWTRLPGGFAVVPSYGSGYAPFGAFNDRASTLNLAAGEPGYTTRDLSVGDRIYLGASPGLAAGYYTLLPARYALLPGGVLVSPQATGLSGPVTTPEGSSIVAGYRFDGFRPSQQPALLERFEVVPGNVLAGRAQYDGFFASSFLRESAVRLGIEVPRLPQDAGRVLVSGLNALRFDGFIDARGDARGYGADIDIDTLRPITVEPPNTATPADRVGLNARLISSFGANSILIGGRRQTTAAGTRITVNTPDLVVATDATLIAPEIILAARNKVEVAERGAVLQGGATFAGAAGTRKPILLGDASSPGSGNGALLLASDGRVRIVRSGVSSQTAQASLAEPPQLVIGSGATLLASALSLDSTYGMSVDPSATLVAGDSRLQAGQISLQLDNAGVVPVIPGLMLDRTALAGLQRWGNLSLLSYSSIDLYGTGTFSSAGALALDAAQIRGFNNNGGTVTFSAPEILLGNLSGGTKGPSSPLSTATLAFDTTRLTLGAGQLAIDNFGAVEVRAADGILAAETGKLTVAGSLAVETPLVAVASGSYAIESAGAASFSRPAVATPGAPSSGLGSKLSIQGASLAVNTDIVLPAGSVTLRATDGALSVGNLAASLIDVGGIGKSFGDITRYADAGSVTLAADNGDIRLGTAGRINAAAAAGGGNAGSLTVSAPKGGFFFDGSVAGGAGAGGNGGSFSLDVASAADITPVDAALNAGGFSASRAYRIRQGDVRLAGTAVARDYALFADAGSVVLANGAFVNASGATGGSIRIGASGDVRLESGAALSVRGQRFDTAGKGGSVVLAAGSPIDGVVDGTAFVDIGTGSSIDLGVDAAGPDSAALGRFAGTLHVRAPYLGGTGLNVNPLAGSITGASAVIVEGFRLFDRTGTPLLDAGLLDAVRTSGQSFATHLAAMRAGLLSANPSLASSLVVVPGAEIINRTGDLVLGASDSTTASDWNLGTLRFGPDSVPGMLTLRAEGDIVFNNSLSDGFTSSSYTAELLARNAALPVNVQSWSYRITAGSDFKAADARATRPFEALASAEKGSIKIGKLYTDNNGIPFASGGDSARTADVIGNRYAQMIRTGSGNIELAAGRDVQLLNQFSTVYTAGTRVDDPTLGGRFQVPPSVRIGFDDGPLGVQQQNPTYAAQFSLGGGNVSIAAQGDIERLTLTGGQLVADSQKQIPNNWLYRRGYVDPETGEFGVTRDGEIGSTAWWIDFSNFFQGIGALGGGHVRLVAGNDVSNVDAVAPTSGRMTYVDPSLPDNEKYLASLQELFELGGGDVTVVAGRDIDAGIYYVERGNGALRAGRDIITNPTRSAYGSLGFGNNSGVTLSEAQWLPTTLFLGKGAFDVRAAGNVTLGPTVNPFLLPIGINNSFFRKSYFSTYAADSAVNVSSLGGTVTLRTATTSPGIAEDKPILMNWMESVHLLPTFGSLASGQPWLRLGETSILPFASMFSLSPGTLRATALTGDIGIAGSLTLSPSAQGTVELAAAGSVSGLQPRGVVPGLAPGDAPRTVWASATINLSDADPANIPGVRSPFAYQVLAGTEPGNAIETGQDFLGFVDRLFAESGSSTGQQASIQTQQALHGRSLLHAAAAEPLRLFATGGNISGLTLFSPKAAQIQAARDITDVALYLQNTKFSDVSSVVAGRDIVAFNANEPVRSAALAGRDLVLGTPLNGDIQISGPGSLLVQAGRNLDLGTGANNADGTGVGITSIGNARNPNLPFAGANLFLGAGLGSGEPDYDAFIDRFVRGEGGEAYLGELSRLTGGVRFDDLTAGQQRLVALQMLYLILRDAGREQQEGGSYDTGFEAISALFPGSGYAGEIITRSRDIRTRSGGDISIFAPGGGLTLATSTVGTPLLPPGIVTEAGGNIGIFTDGDVNIGISRIFTLRGGNQIIWSSAGDIAAGASSKTVQSAPPTRVLIDPQTAELKVDLGGLATGGGIGVLASVQGVEPGSVDLIAPEGVVDAGDAGIRSTGNLSIAATQVLNADNISVGGASAGVPSAPVAAAPNISGLTAGANANAATSSAAQNLANPGAAAENQVAAAPSIITVEVLGYGGSSDEAPAEEEEEDRDRRSAAL